MKLKKQDNLLSKWISKTRHKLWWHLVAKGEKNVFTVSRNTVFWTQYPLFHTFGITFSGTNWCKVNYNGIIRWSLMDREWRWLECACVQQCMNNRCCNWILRLSCETLVQLSISVWEARLQLQYFCFWYLTSVAIWKWKSVNCSVSALQKPHTSKKHFVINLKNLQFA